jgi:hypothetical protein
MERSARLGKAENQAARAIFFVRVILDNFTSLDRLSDFTHAYAAQDGWVGGVQQRPLSAGVRQPISLTTLRFFQILDFR